MIKLNFNNKTVLVTGASKGIGKSIAEEFLKANAKVVLTYKSLAPADLVKKYSKNQLLCFKSDASLEEDRLKLFKDIKESFGKIDILINNAGIANRKKINEETDANFLHTLHLNTVSPYIMAKHFKNQLEKSEGVIINLGSLRGFIPTGAAYGASKAALHNLTIALAQELSPLVRVNCVAPGITLTPMNESKGKEKLEKIAKNSLLQKNAQSQDIAYSTLFLASKYANCITGQTLLVDNGSTFIIKS